MGALCLPPLALLLGRRLETLSQLFYLSRYQGLHSVACRTQIIDRDFVAQYEQLAALARSKLTDPTKPSK